MGGEPFFVFKESSMAKIPTRKFSTTKKKIASRRFAKGTAKIASRKSPTAAAKDKKKQAAQELLDRPTDEKTRQDRLSTLMGRTSALKSGNEL